jgi:hypothetical protein
MVVVLGAVLVFVLTVVLVAEPSEANARYSMIRRSAT